MLNLKRLKKRKLIDAEGGPFDPSSDVNQGWRFSGDFLVIFGRESR
jgi:hypothetical protein